MSVSEAKSHLRLNLTDTTHDDMLTMQIAAATERVEQDTDRQLITATFIQTHFCFSESGDVHAELKLQKKGAFSVASIKYYDADGAQQTIASSNYIVDVGRGSVFPKPDYEWPTVEANHPNGVEITFSAGFGSTSTSLPSIFKQAVLLCVGKWFFDPAQESSALHSQEIAYDRLIALIQRPAY